MASFCFSSLYTLSGNEVHLPYSRQNNICNTRLYSKETTKCNASVICMITCRVSYVRIRRYL